MANSTTIPTLRRMDSKVDAINEEVEGVMEDQASGGNPDPTATD